MLAATLLLAGCSGGGPRASATAAPSPVPSAPAPAPSTPTATTTTSSPTPTPTRRPAPTPAAPALRAAPAPAPTCSVPAWVTAAQVVLVVSSGSSATVRACHRSGSRYLLDHGPYAGHVGIRGVSDAKREGDLTTPAGTFPLRGGFGVDGNPGLALGWFRVDARDVWVDDPSSSLYNTHQRTPADGRWSSAESLEQPAGVRLRPGHRLQRGPRPREGVGDLPPRRPRRWDRRMRVGADLGAADDLPVGAAGSGHLDPLRPLWQRGCGGGRVGA